MMTNSKSAPAFKPASTKNVKEAKNVPSKAMEAKYVPSKVIEPKNVMEAKKPTKL